LLIPVAVELTPWHGFVPAPWSLLGYRVRHFPPGWGAKRTVRCSPSVGGLLKLESPY
jgi:hypothetical protein